MEVEEVVEVVPWMVEVVVRVDSTYNVALA